MTAQLSPQPTLQFFNNNATFLAGGQLSTYAAGTSTPQATYTDSTQTTVNANPVILNARGEAAVWFNPALSYKLVLADSVGNGIWTRDNIPGGSVTLSQITQSLLGGVLYPISATEAAKGFNTSNTNIWHPYGSVLRYGADPTGVLDSSVAFQAAIQCNADVFDDYPGGGVYLFSYNTVFLSTYPLTIRGQAKWAGGSSGALINGTKIIIGSALGSNAAFTASSAIYGLKVQNIGFTWQSMTQGQNAFVFNSDCRYTVIENCAFINSLGATAGNNVVAINFANTSIFTGDVILRDNFFDALNGILLQSSCTTIKIYGNEFYGHHGVNAINSFGTLTGGSGYTTGTYNNTALTGGSGSGATANITVTGGIVTAVTLVASGTGYANTDSVSAAGLGAGSSFAIAVASVGNEFGFGIQVNYPVSEPVITSNYFEGFSTGIYSNGAAYLKQIGNDYGPNVNHWTWIKTSAARIWNQSFGETFAGAGAINYTQNNVDLCQVLSGPGTYYLDNAVLNAGLGFQELNRGFKLGFPQAVAYLAGNFTAQTGTWTPSSGNQSYYAYSIEGKTMTVWFTIAGGAVSGTPTWVGIAIPGGYTSAGAVTNGCNISNNGSWSQSACAVAASGAVIEVFATPSGAGTFSTTAIAEGQITFPVN